MKECFSKLVKLKIINQIINRLEKSTVFSMVPTLHTNQ